MATFTLFNDMGNDGSITVYDLADPQIPFILFPNGDSTKPILNPLPQKTTSSPYMATSASDGSSSVRWTSPNIGFGQTDAIVQDGQSYNVSDGSILGRRQHELLPVRWIPC